VNGGETSLISRFAIPVALGLGPYSTGRTLHCLQVLTTPFPCLISASYFPLSLVASPFSFHLQNLFYCFNSTIRADLRFTYEQASFLRHGNHLFLLMDGRTRVPRTATSWLFSKQCIAGINSFGITLLPLKRLHLYITLCIPYPYSDPFNRAPKCRLRRESQPILSFGRKSLRVRSQILSHACLSINLFTFRFI
jgi:hypothetical protein